MMNDPSRRRFGWHFGLGLLLCVALAGPARAQFTPVGGLSGLGGAGDSEGALKVHAEFTAPAGDRPAQLAITADVPDGWHTFSITQKPGGPNATKIKLKPSDEYRVSGPFVADPPPKIDNDPKLFDVPMEEHFGRVTWTAPLEIAAGVDPAKLEIHGAVNAQRCASECLRPEDFSFVARLAAATAPASGTTAAAAASGTTSPVAKPPIPSISDPIAVPPTGAIPAAPAASAPPQIGQYQSPQSHALLRGWVEPAVAAPGTVVKLVIVAEPAPTYHVYAWAPNDRNTPAGNGKPTLIVLAEGHFDPTAPAQPDRAATVDTSAAGAQHVYDAPVHWTISTTVPNGTPPGEYPFAGFVGYQTCSQSCDLPQGVRFDGKLVVGETTKPGMLPLEFRPAHYSDAAKVAAAVNPSIGPASALPMRVDDTSHYSLAVIIGFSLLGGLILNLMPCVLPVLGLKILSLVEQGGHSRAGGLMLNLWYSAGLMAVFLVLGTLSAFSGLAWGQQFQSAAFTITLAAMVFAMALSFLGVWEIPIPGFVGSGKAVKLAAREGALGAFVKGALTTVLATPCSGPFLGAVFGYTLRQPAHVTYLIFGSLGLGMASPYLLVGAFPQLIRFLPKPGLWMETFKQVMAFFMLATVVYLFSLLRQRSELLVPTFALLMGVWAGCWLIGRTPLTADLGRKLRAWGAGALVVAVIGIAAFRFLIPGESLLNWEPFSPARLEQLTNEGRTVMLEFTADWCPNCKWNLLVAIDTQKVKEKVAANDVVAMKADETIASPEIDRVKAQLGSKSIPLLAIFPAGRPDRPIVLRDVLTEHEVLSALEQAGPSRNPTATAAAR